MSNSSPDIVDEYLAKDALLCVLYDALDKLCILRNTSVFREEEKKYENTDFEPKSFLETVNDQELNNCEIFQEIKGNETITDDEIKKLSHERDYLDHILNNLVNEIQQSGSISTLEQTVQHLEQLKREEEQLVEEYLENQRTILDLKQEIKIEQANAKATLDELSKFLPEIADEELSKRTEIGVKLRYLEKWYKNQRAQEIFKNYITVSEISSDLANMETAVRNEFVIHDNIVKFYEVDEKDLEKQFEDYIKKYEIDTKMKDEEIEELRGKRKEIQGKISDLENQIKQRQAEMDVWLKQKQKIKEQKEYEERRLQAVIKIQSWWRATLVRRFIGQFSKLRLLKKGEKKGKKGKK